MKAQRGREEQRIKTIAATRLQSLWRRHVKRNEFILVVRSIKYLQVLLRNKLAKKKIRSERAAAVVIQKTWRSFWAQMHVQLTLMDITAIQRFIRGKLANIRKDSICRALNKLRHALRGYIETRRWERKLRLSKAFVLCHRSAIIFQVCLCQVSEQNASA